LAPGAWGQKLFVIIPYCQGVEVSERARTGAPLLSENGGFSRAQPQHRQSHSPRIANNGNVADVIVAEAVGRNWIEYELWNLRRQLHLAGEVPAWVEHILAMKEVCMHRLLSEKQSEPEIERTQPECKVHNVYPAPAAYMQEATAMNIAEPWTKFHLPPLVIYGDADFVTTETDHRRIAGIVNAAHPGTATLRMVAGMDHHLDFAGTAQQAYDLRVKQQRLLPYDAKLSTTALDCSVNGSNAGHLSPDGGRRTLTQPCGGRFLPLAQ
jgi:hypothetical protein